MSAKLGKFIFPTDFEVLDMKEDDDLSIILGIPFLSTARALIDIHDSKLTLWVEDEQITYEMNRKVSYDMPTDEVLRRTNLEGESLSELEEIERFMEEELKVLKKPHVENVKCSKPRPSIPMTFEMFVFTTPKY